MPQEDWYVIRLVQANAHYFWTERAYTALQECSSVWTPRIEPAHVWTDEEEAQRYLTGTVRRKGCSVHRVTNAERKLRD